MNNENVNVNGAENNGEETVTKKRPSRAKAKKTGAQIVEEINALHVEVEDLEAALSTLESDTTAHDIVSEAVEAKKVELEAALSHTFTV